MRKLLVVALGEVVLFLLLLTAATTLAMREDSTMYSLSYSEHAFRSIQVGDSSQRVRHLLGLPLSIRAGDGDMSTPRSGSLAQAPDADGTTWSYTMPGRLPGSCAQHIRRIVFNADGRVEGIEAYYVGD